MRDSLAVAAVALLCGCAANQPMPMNAPLDLTPVQLLQLEKQAADGRGDAAYRISLYYGGVEFDEAKSHYWLEKAAALRWKPAMISLANELLDSSNPTDRSHGRRLKAEAEKLPEV
jgi:TPR repeat protein